MMHHFESVCRRTYTAKKAQTNKFQKKHVKKAEGGKNSSGDDFIGKEINHLKRRRVRDSNIMEKDSITSN